MTHPSPKRNMVPKSVLMRSCLVSLTTARPVNTAQSRTTVNSARPVNTAQPRTTVNSARPMTNIFNKAHSTVKSPINNKTTTKNSNFKQKVNTARLKALLNVVKGNQVNVVKASAYWVWKPKTKVIDHVSKHNSNPQMDLQDQGVIDSGCSRHMTGNMSYLTDFEEIDGGYVAFGDFDKLTVMAPEHSSSGPALHEMTPAIISSGLVPNPPPSTSFVPPSRTDCDLLFQPLFEELLTPLPSFDDLAPKVIALIPKVVALELAESTGSPSSTTVDQDAPSPSNSQTTPET
ncbi:hypothetical protein Tco_0530253 [Tanacetum coccineum]